ncbi:MAG: aminopeptidase [Bacteroidetes bacterium]|nr:aminopeptidase [Bacteroidota bacterium]
MRIRKFFLVLADLLFAPLFVFALFNVSLLVYGVKMGNGQLTIIREARPITEVLADAAVPDSVKSKLRLIQEIRAFAFDKLGLTRNDNYSTFYDQQGKPVIYVVTACEKFSLKPHRWSYSLLGKMPYRGFFEKPPAETEIARLQAAGYDADLGGAAGWSTLGWFNDPVLSQMLRYSEGELAELIIHELTHGTIFVTNDVEYNENLASFVGCKGAIAFLAQRYGINSPQLEAYKQSLIDQRRREKFLITAAQQLDSLYNTFPAVPDTVKCLALRNEAYNRICAKAEAQGDTIYARRLRKRFEKSGNTVVMHALRYGEKQDDFETEYSRFTNVAMYIQWLKEKFGK